MGNLTSDGQETFPDARVFIGPLDYEREQGKENVLHGYRVVTILTTNGQFWQLIYSLPFDLNEGKARALWHEHPELFTQIDPKTNPVPIDKTR